MWLLFALLSGLFYTGSNLITRHVLKKESNDAWAFSFFFSAIGALVSLPFMLTNIKVGTTVIPWLIMMGVGLLIVAQNFLYFASAKYVAPSISGSITKFRLVWVMILGIVILHESSSLLKIAGTLLTIFSGIIVIKKFSKPKNVRGIIYSLGATIFYAIVIILYKLLFSSFNSQSLTFFIFLIPALINLVIMPNAIKRIRGLIKSNYKSVIAGCVFGALANLAMNQALSIGEAGKVLVLIESFLVVTLIGEHLILKEKKDLLTKAVAVISATAGAILIKLS